jgi:hypothetical protein
MGIRRSTILASSIASAFVAGCGGDPTDADVRGVYVLDRVGNQPLPAVVFENSAGSVRIIADTLRLTGDGRGSTTSIQVFERQGSGSTADAPTRYDGQLAYALSGSRIMMDFICGPNALCLAGPHLIARRGAPGLVVEWSITSDEPMYYRRVLSVPEY